MKTLETVVVFVVLLLAAVVLISLSGRNIIDPVKTFISIFSPEKRCIGHERTVSDFERMIKGYTESGDHVQAFQLCRAYYDCFPPEFNAFEKNYETRRDGSYCRMVRI